MSIRNILKLSEVTTLITDGTHSSPKVIENEKIPYITVKDVNNGKINFTNSGRITLEDYEKFAKTGCNPKKGDVLFSKDGTVGRAAYVDSEKNFIVLSSLSILRPNTEVIVPIFLYYSSIAPYFQAQAISKKTGSAIPRIVLKDINTIEVIVPPLDEQVRIANVLSSLDNLINNNKQQIQKTLELSRAYYDLIVKDVENTVELKTIAEFNKQSTKKQDSGKVTYIEISNVKDGIIEWCDEIDWSEAATSARRLVAKGDTIWSNVRPNRRSHSLVLDKPDNMVVTTGMTVISPISEKIGAAFLFATLDSRAYSSYLAQHADGTTYPTVSEEHFANSIIPMPEQKEIDKFEKVMFPLWEDAKRAEMDNIKLSKMRDELLPLLISGEITVKEAEEQIEG
jgi:type I restriction enzyme, S subunit